jgi:aspartokinase
VLRGAPVICDHGDAELLCLHGPHFQDRYGVAHAAVSCLQKHGVNALAIGCTGSSVYLAVSAQTGDVAVRALTEVFIVPKV